MAEVTRVSGLRNTVGTLYADNCNLFLITVKVAAGTAVDLQAEDDAINEVVESIVRELNPSAFFVPADSSGKIHVVMDKSVNDAAELQVRIRNMGNSLGANNIDVTGTTVAVPTSLTLA
jgi:hypothetical protein